MNEKRKRILVGLAAGTALTLTLGMTAHAEELDPAEGTGSDLNTTQDVTPTPPETGGETAGGETTGGETTGSTTNGNTPEAQDGGTDVTPEAPAAPVVTVGGFDLADKYRTPVMLLADGTMGQMMEPVEIHTPEVKEYDKSWALTGTGLKRKHNVINSLSLDAYELERFNLNRFERYKLIEENEPLHEEYMMEDAEICVVAFGIAARVAKNAIVQARKEGVKVGLIRPITLWPFPKQALAAAAEKCASFITVELNMGQMVQDVRLAISCKRPVLTCTRTGGVIPSPAEVRAKIMEAAQKGGAE